MVFAPLPQLLMESRPLTEFAARETRHIMIFAPQERGNSTSLVNPSVTRQFDQPAMLASVEAELKPYTDHGDGKGESLLHSDKLNIIIIGFVIQLQVTFLCKLYELNIFNLAIYNVDGREPFGGKVLETFVSFRSV